MTEAQRNAIEQYWPVFGLPFTTEPVDLNLLFKRQAPRILDIGTGMGATTVQLARQYPENDYLAVEVHRPGIGSLLRLINKYNLTNIRISDHDVMDVLNYQIADNSLDMVYIFFPDPWPKKRHHKRRLINPVTLSLLKLRMKSHARLHIATDWNDYAAHILDMFASDPDFINLAGTGRPTPRPYWRPLTKFEQRGQRLEHHVWDFTFMRKSIITIHP